MLESLRIYPIMAKKGGIVNKRRVYYLKEAVKEYIHPYWLTMTRF